MCSVHREETGFSLVETVVASALLLLVMGVVFQALNPAQGAFRTAPERADVQQRLRVALTVLARTIGQAGSGPVYGAAAGPLVERVAAVFPYRVGRRNADAPGTARPDAMTVLWVERGAHQASLAQPLAASSGPAVISLESHCPQGDPSCGFTAGSMVLVVGDAGRFDLFSVTAVQATTLTLQHNTRDSLFVYPAGSAIVEVHSRTFSLKPDLANDQFQLVRYDGDDGAEAPVVDHVAALSFRYRAEPLPPRMIKSVTDPNGPWTTYGPRPPVPIEQPTSFPPGENCVFQLDGASNPSPRLPDLGASALVDLPLSQLNDGPWCADEADPNRFDADLLRVRAVTVTVRIEASAASLRGPAGLLFARGGTAHSADRVVVDAEQTLDLTPPNLFPGR